VRKWCFVSPLLIWRCAMSPAPQSSVPCCSGRMGSSPLSSIAPSQRLSSAGVNRPAVDARSNLAKRRSKQLSLWDTHAVSSTFTADNLQVENLDYASWESS
jgi:hypothetical protein